MKRYYCNGKKGYCDRGNDNDIDCTACEFANGDGGEIVDCPDTNFETIKCMSIEALARFMNECGHDFPPYCDCKTATKGTCDQNCLECAKKWLESEVEGK